MLNGKLRLHDVKDVEALAARIVQRSGLELSYHDREDLLAYLVETAWELSLRYERGEPQHPPRFSVYATSMLRLRVIDWQRSRYGRTVWSSPRTGNGKLYAERYERPRNQPVSLEHEQRGKHHDDGPSHGLESNRLARAYAALSVDPASDRSPDLMRVLRGGGSERARRDKPLDTQTPRRAA